jgi:raffinose/stachyose/melibiose transport system permease protein
MTTVGHSPAGARSRSAGGPAGSRRARRGGTLRTRYQWTAYLYLVPALIFYVAFLIRPMIDSLWISFFDWNGITASTWAGFANYVSVLSDPLIWQAVGHSLIFIVFYALVPIALALLFVGIIARIKVRGLVAFRAMLFVPYILSTVVVAISWRWIYDLNGPLNGLLRLVGLGRFAQAWLGEFSTALPAVGVIGTWIMFGLAFVLFVSGIQKIPSELFEASRMDGAGAVPEFFAVTLPALRGEIRVALVLMITAALRNFDIVWNTTSGGPGTSTTVPSYYVYEGAFITHQVGRASSIAVLMTIFILCVIGVVMWLMAERDRLPLRRRMRLSAEATARNGAPS